MAEMPEGKRTIYLGSHLAHVDTKVGFVLEGTRCDINYDASRQKNKFSQFIIKFFHNALLLLLLISRQPVGAFSIPYTHLHHHQDAFIRTP